MIDPRIVVAEALDHVRARARNRAPSPFPMGKRIGCSWQRFLGRQAGNLKPPGPPSILVFFPSVSFHPTSRGLSPHFSPHFDFTSVHSSRRSHILTT